MAEADVDIAWEITVEVENAAGAGTYFEIADVIAVKPPSVTIQDVDVTHQKSPGRADEFRKGRKNYGTASWRANLKVGSATDLFLLAWVADETVANRLVKITWPDGDVDTFPAYPQAYDIAEAEPGAKLGYTFNMKAAGVPERT